MKKNTLAMLFLLSSAFIFAKDDKVSLISGSNGKSDLKATGKNIPSVGQTSRLRLPTNQINAAFFTEDFAAGIPAGWSNIDAAGNGVFWAVSDTGAINGDTLSSIGTTAANGYILFDSDGSGTSVGGEDGILTTSAIDCSGKPFIMLSLNEFFAQYAASTGVISISNDSIIWTEVHHVETGLDTNQTTLNPFAISLDISALAGNQATVYIRFEFIGNYDYYWMIDDVTLSQPSSIDAAIIDVPLDFNGCTLSASEPVNVEVQNLGANPISNFGITYSSDGGAPVTETYTDTLNYGETATHTFTSTVDFSTTGVHQIDAYLSLAGDTINSNDSLSTVTVSYDHVNLTTGAYTMGFEPTNDFSSYIIEYPDGDVGVFDISPDFTHSGVGCLRKALSNVADDKWVFTQCVDLLNPGAYSISFWYMNFDLNFICGLEVMMGTSPNAADMTIPVLVTPLPTDTLYKLAVAPLIAAPGTYYIGFHFTSTSPVGTSSERLDDITIDFNDGVKENSVASMINIFPNPSNGAVNISNKNVNEKKFALNVYNFIGELIITESYNDLTFAQIDLSSQPSGIYSIQLKSASTTINKSVAITK